MSMITITVAIMLFLLIQIISSTFVHGFLGPTVHDIMTIGQLKDKSLLIITKDKTSYIIERNKKDEWTNTWPVSEGNGTSMEKRWPWIDKLSLYEKFIANDHIRDSAVIQTNDGNDGIMLYGEKTTLLLNLDKQKASIVDTTKIKNFNLLLPLSIMNRSLSFMENDTKSLTIRSYEWKNDHLANHSNIDYLYCSNGLVTIAHCPKGTMAMPFPVIKKVFANEKNDLIFFDDTAKMVYKFPLFSGLMSKTKKSFFLHDEPMVNSRLLLFLMMLLIMIAIVEFLIIIKCGYDHGRMIGHVRRLSKLNSTKNVRGGGGGVVGGGDRSGVVVKGPVVLDDDSSSIIQTKDKSKKPKKGKQTVTTKATTKATTKTAATAAAAAAVLPPPAVQAPAMAADSFVNNDNSSSAMATSSTGSKAKSETSNNSSTTTTTTTTAEKSQSTKGLKSDISDVEQQSTLSEISTSNKKRKTSPPSVSNKKPKSASKSKKKDDNNSTKKKQKQQQQRESPMKKQRKR
ncbi:hypothetical protein DERF_008505 [Dermatophagoides farinae]|uniref:Uncharacterized protein n=1 Tax=Dermatophagoides farinae TaxID=6954 RepID=A0A922L990_DERFA|nr:hypothetical protein DERF_008505 [Dermatophagoides farinae]